MTSNHPVRKAIAMPRIHLGDLEEPVAALTGDFDGSDLPDTPIPLTIVLIVVAA